MCSPLNHLALINTDTLVCPLSYLQTRNPNCGHMAAGFRHFPSYLPSSAKTPRRCTGARILQLRLMNVSPPYTWTYCQNWPPRLQENCPLEYTNAGLCRSQPLSNEEPYQQQAVPRKRPPRHFNIELVDKQRDKKCENDRRRGASQDKTWLPVFAGPSEETRTMRTQDFLLPNSMTTSCLRPTF